jgi:hypothetical protein
MTLNTDLVAGVAVGQRDDGVLRALRAAAKVQGGAPETWRVAVKNELGAIYRTALLDGIHQFAIFDRAMEELGFVDEIPEDVSQVDGFDAIFRIGRPGPRKRANAVTRW